MKKSGYAGSIKNSGVQVVKAPFSDRGKGGEKVVKTGGDLRSKGGKK